jgi:acyl-CoA-dependent ceramide synthase
MIFLGGPRYHTGTSEADKVIPRAGIALNLIAFVFLSHTCLSEVRNHTSKFFLLSYYNPTTGKYAAGFDDLYFITFCIILFTGLRAGIMEYVLAPIARLGGLFKSKEVTRFSEQAWLTTWCFIVWPLGMVGSPKHSIENAY